MDPEFIKQQKAGMNNNYAKSHSQNLLYGENNPQMLIDNLEVAIYTCNADGLITMYNAPAVRLWGREPEIGKDLWCGSWKIYELDGITEIPLEMCPMALTLKEGKPVNGHEILIQKPDGERRFVIPYPRPFLDEQGIVTGAINLLVDVTEYKRREQREAHLAAIVDSSDDAIASKTLNGIITSWNPGAQKIFGYSTAEMVGQSVFKIIPIDRWQEEYYIQDQLRNGNKIDHYETKRMTKDGRIIEVSLTISPILDKTGKIIGASKIARDITKQIRTTQSLQESEERYKLAVETANLGAWALDIATTEIVFSAQCKNILGINDDDLHSTLDELMALVYPEDINQVRQQIAEAIDSRLHSYYNMEYRVYRKNDHTIKWVRVKAKMYINEDSKPQKLIGTMLDITDERNSKDRLEKTVKERTSELEKMNERLQRSNSELEQFAYIASHDLQEPLRKIQTYIGIIGESTSEDATKYFSKIRKSASRMSTLIQDVLNYSRIGKDDSQFTNVNLNRILEDLKNDYENLICEKRAIITSSDLTEIHGNESQIRQLFANLLSNALKFCVADCRISITSDYPGLQERSVHDFLDPDKSYIRLVFSDNGIGFDNKYAEKIFMIFQRLHHNSNYAGTGIGLSLCKKIVENHHGYIVADSPTGTGATFTVWLPTTQ